MRRLLAYAREAFPPAHAAFAVAWWSAAHGWSGPPSRLALGGLHALLALLALRVVDDWKDEPYDRRHHPGRPLPAGRVTPRELALLLALLAAGLVAVNAALGPAFVALAGLQLGWAAAIAAWRRLGHPLADRWLLEVVLVQPLNLLLTGHALLAAGEPRPLPVVAACWGALLQLEVLRKTADGPRPGEELYSNLAGRGPALVGAALLALVAAAGVAAVAGPWPIGPAFVAYATTLGLRPAWRRAAGVAFLAATLLLLGARSEHAAGEVPAGRAGEAERGGAGLEAERPVGADLRPLDGGRPPHRVARDRLDDRQRQVIAVEHELAAVRGERRLGGVDVEAHPVEAPEEDRVQLRAHGPTAPAARR